MSSLVASERPAAGFTPRAAALSLLLQPLRYWRLLVTIAALLSIPGIVELLVAPRTYVADLRLASTGGPSVRTDAELIAETPVAQRVVSDLHLPVNAGQLLSHVRAQPIDDTLVLDVRASWPDPQTAVAIANDLAASFIALHPSARVAVTQSASAQSVLSPNLSLGPPLVVLVALVLSYLAVFFFNRSRDRIGDESDVTLHTDLPPLARVDDARRPIAGGEPARRLRTEVAYQELWDAIRTSSGRAPRTIAVMSPSRSDGKSTIALNLALSIAERDGPAVVVDADLRAPSLHELLHAPEVPGLGDVLSGAVPLEDAVRHTPHSSVHVLTCGSPVRDPIESLQPERLRPVLDALAERYSIVVIDTSTLGYVRDAVEIARSADGALLVICSGNTTNGDLVRALDRLARAGTTTLVGYALNRAKTPSERLAYYRRPKPVFANAP